MDNNGARYATIRLNLFGWVFISDIFEIDCDNIADIIYNGNIFIFQDNYSDNRI
jgi:hypothetical protein